MNCPRLSMMQGISTGTMVPQGLLASCNRTPWAGWSQLSNWTRYGAWWSHPSICSALQQVLSISGQKRESCEERSRRQHHPVHLALQGCSAACFLMSKSKWEMTVQRPWQGKVNACLLGCFALRHLCTSPSGAPQKAWVKYGAWKKKKKKDSLIFIAF